MKLAIIGGGGVRVPLLVNGLIGRGLPFTEVALFDPDSARLEVIAGLAEARAGQARITRHDSVGACVDAAEFIVTSIRVGGLAARQHDETVSLAHGVVGQETVGPAGFAMAVRTVPVLDAYAREIAARAPSAWVINFSNPVGLVTQAMRGAAPGLRVVGICDTPTELFAEIAHALRVPVAECAFDYLGLNHLGWVRDVRRGGESMLAAAWDDRELLGRIYSRPLFDSAYLAARRLLPTEYVYYYDFPDRAVANIRAAGTSRGEVVRRGGESMLAAAWDDRELLGRIYSRPLFDSAYLAARRLLPTEYVYYYDFPDRAVANIRAAGTSRGEVVRRLTDRLFADLASSPADPVRVYEQYLATRSASYMQIESGQPAPNPPSPWAELTGYDRIAFDVMHAIVNDTGAVIPLNVANDGNIPELAADDVIEVPCAIGASGLRPRHAGALPPPVRDLVITVKAYERQVMDAAPTMDHRALADALASNPLVPSRDLAARLVGELQLR